MSPGRLEVRRGRKAIAAGDLEELVDAARHGELRATDLLCTPGAAPVPLRAVPAFGRVFPGGAERAAARQLRAVLTLEILLLAIAGVATAALRYFPGPTRDLVGDLGLLGWVVRGVAGLAALFALPVLSLWLRWCRYARRRLAAREDD